MEIEIRDCAWGCARGMNTTWEYLQIEKHKSVRWAEWTPAWFLLFDLQIFSSSVYPRAQPHAQSLFLVPIVFGINLIHFSMRRRTGQPEIRSFVSVLRSPVTPFDRSKKKNAKYFEELNVFGNGKCELSAIQEGRKRCKFLARKSAKLFASATKVTSLPSLSLSLSLSLCNSLSPSLSLSLSLSLSAPHAQ